MATMTLAMDRRLQFSVSGLVRGVAWPLSILAFVAHLAWGDQDYPIESLACAGLLAAGALLSAAYVKPGTIPVIPITLFRFYLAMGWPVFAPPVIVTSAFGRVRISSHAMIEGSIGGVVFATCMVAAAIAVVPFARKLQRPLANSFDTRGEYTSSDTITIRFIAVVALVFNIIVSAFASRMHLLPPSFGYVASLFGGPEIPLGFLFWDAYNKPTFWSRALPWVTLTILTIAGLATGMLGSATLPWITALLLMWALKGRIPLGLFSILFAAILILNPAKVVYRRLSWNKAVEPTLIERTENWATAISGVFTGMSEDAVGVSGDAASGVASRMSSLLQVIHVFEWVPGRVPYAGPDAWYSLPLFYVPTLFWPERPNTTKEFNVKYATTFQILNARSIKVQTVTVPSVGDGYWRLGWLGVVMEGLLLGAIIGLFHGLSNPSSRALTIIGVGFIIRGGGPEGCALGLLAGLPKYVIVLALVLLLAQWLPAMISKAGRILVMQSSFAHTQGSNSRSISRLFKR